MPIGIRCVWNNARSLRAIRRESTAQATRNAYFNGRDESNGDPIGLES